MKNLDVSLSLSLSLSLYRVGTLMLGGFAYRRGRLRLGPLQFKSVTVKTLHLKSKTYCFQLFLIAAPSNEGK